MADDHPTQMWHTSRSAFERGTSYCPFARYVEYHAGPFGYGFQRKAQSLPLVTGTYTHAGPTAILQWVIDARQHNGVQPDAVPDDVVRWACEQAIEKYKKVIHTRGVLTYGGDDPEATRRLETLVTEQSYLIEGLIWQWALQRLPVYLRDYVIVAVEEEETLVLDCTCGMGDRVGDVSDHESRGCLGIVLQSRPDLIASRRSDGAYGYVEFKTAGQARKTWADSWERKQQFLMGIVGAERRHGVEITHTWVEGLIKGKRQRPWGSDPETPKIQDTMLCYPYYKPPTVPGELSEWRPQYNYIDRDGLEYTAGRKEGYRKTALWEIPRLDAFPGIPDEMSVSEYWSKVLVEEYPFHAAKCISVIGPLPKQREQIDKALRSLVAEEKLWQDRLWRIYEFAQANSVEWGDDRFMQFVESVVPRSWNCDPFGPDHPCPNQPICHPVTDDWRDPVARELFVYRVPHHDPEKQQAVSRGLVPHEGWGQEDEEVEEGEAE
ncbi:MAG TPA: hypothetical protein VFO16_01530 [Pseudonocardiaceae bacterium]|nr:hypothetical protein [Pseudonocardiaceae bacterium]